MKGKNVLITGISGFVGSHMAKYLLNNKANVFGLVKRRSDGTKPKNLIDRKIEDEAHLIEGDITDISGLGFALEESQPDVVFHLAAQSFIPRSFSHPLETLETNLMGTANLLESIRIKDINPIVIFAGSSEEYGLVISSEKQYERIIKEKNGIFPEPDRIPELPVNERNPLRPMSPYAVSKVACDYMMRNYYHSYGLKTIVSRAFNTEGAGRGTMFVTAVITNQVMKLKLGEADKIIIGNVNAFRDWSHILDIVKGYCLLAEKGKYGDVYNQGSERTNSVLSYILLSLENAGWKIEKIESMKNSKVIKNPTENANSDVFGRRFEKTEVDKLMIEDELYFSIEDKGILVHTDKGKIKIEFNPDRFRVAEVPILLSDKSKIQKLGFNIKYKLRDIIRDQLNYFMKKENRVG